MKSIRGAVITFSIIAVLAGFLPGVPLVIWFLRNPADAGMTSYWTGSGLILGGCLMLIMGMWIVLHELAEQHQRQHGVPGHAKLLRIDAVKRSKRKLVLRVTSPTHGTYDTTVDTDVPQHIGPTLHVGQQLSVLVNFRNREHVRIDWEAPIKAPTSA